MTNEEAIKMLKSKMDGHTDTSYEWAETVRMAIKALMQQQNIHDTCKKCVEFSEFKQQPCEDAVSRKDVHDMLENLPVTVENHWFNWLQKACIRLAELPSVTPTRPTARWIESPNGVYVECSICGSHWEKGFVEHCNMQYCPDCGAKMTESEEEI